MYMATYDGRRKRCLAGTLGRAPRANFARKYRRFTFFFTSGRYFANNKGGGGGAGKPIRIIIIISKSKFLQATTERRP